MRAGARKDCAFLSEGVWLTANPSVLRNRIARRAGDPPDDWLLISADRRPEKITIEMLGALKRE